ncbi:uncharacterized protein SPPG_02028 [Spizellomyces punctatus DAOM BR117]|uniref:PCI domain-containing protein n=1 Tax=Spizellomyces punctatus (strain DAOM BR117) TaxID=645134 RepID=A0A0L0HQ66_SPIPD|nr:uncharacterized protein SPPG_02028 [Spizellomyces punctatus DAOM BR117]KND02949.1 hypothetical protein SPPG_02028 [Spizellomyces punctatus DAOM BR117]|eukprot:XP_016610988.1 hypothetical protein SPPG_02028 [Spizellomyces punctatus DAOM BR117]
MMDIDLPLDQNFNQPPRRPAEAWDEAADENNESKKKKTSTIIVDNPTLDLESYSANYVGHTRVERLIFIAEHSPPLAIDAYKIALNDLKNTMDYTRYTVVHQKLNDLLLGRGLPTIPLDQTWVDNTKKAQRAKTEKLERELKDYKSNLIKESIRMGHNDLGDHLYDSGDLSGALKSYSRTRDYCTTSKHIVDMCINVARLSMELNNFAHVQSYVVKAETTPDIPEKNIVTSKLNCIMGLVNLEAGKFKRAARNFLDTSFELNTHFSEVLSPNDVAIYGGLCALATFDRSELKSRVFDNADFKQFLELEPQVRELLSNFYHSKYSLCLDILEKMKNDLYLDIWLHGHVDMIYQSIRKKALVQYFYPFLSVDLNLMAQAFSTTVPELEQELATLITSKEIQARIDSHNKILRIKSADQRTNIFEKSLAMGSDYQTQVKHMLLRMKLVRADMIVRPPERDRHDSS